METILTNSKARHEYHIEETYEAGIVLTGTEVKSLRAGKGQIRDAFARVDNDEVWLYNVHISEYSHGNTANHQPKAPRKLLLHKREIQKLFAIAAIKGKALVPLSFYWKNGKVKVQLAVGRGKGVADKRDTIKQRDSERELQQAMMRRRYSTLTRLSRSSLRRLDVDGLHFEFRTPGESVSGGTQDSIETKIREVEGGKKIAPT